MLKDMIILTIAYRDSINKIDPYIPGKSIEDVKREYNLEHVIRLASNENAHGASNNALDAAVNSLKNMSLYPDSSAKLLRKELSSFYGVKKDEVFTANGADNVLSILISAYINEGDEVVYCTPTFPVYKSATLLMGGSCIEVPMTNDWKYDLNGMLEKITNKTKMVFICNPNNPTGTIVSNQEILDFLDKVPSHVQVVLDEAYIEYIDDEDYLTGIELFKQSYRIILVRTFSKFYGLAGLRIGYAVGSNQVLEPMLRIREAFATNRVAIEAGVAALKDQEFTRKHLLEVNRGREYLYNELTEMGFEVFQSYSNFIFVNFYCNTLNLFEELLQYGYIIRPCAPWKLSQYARVSIGTMEQNKSFINVLKKSYIKEK